MAVGSARTLVLHSRRHYGEHHIEGNVRNGIDSSVDGTGPLVSNLTFDPNNVSPGGAFVATVPGTGLSGQTYFDIRFRAPGSTTEQEAANWQQGTSATHAVPASIQTETYIVTAVRAHRDVGDHTGPYIPVSASFAVGP